jgi:pseudouridylate synthase
VSQPIWTPKVDGMSSSTSAGFTDSSSSAQSPAVSSVRVHPSVAEALRNGVPVVALESTISSTLGLPVPHNAEVLARCSAIIRAGGAVPALTCVIDGVARVGIDPEEALLVLGGTRKCAERDLAVAVAQRWSVGVTTVSATVTLAAAVGVKVFATGGIGGVHRHDHLTGDVSADLGALARHPVITVTAGAKAFLDLGKTLEYFDTLGVPVLGFGTNDFPAFYTRSSGFPVPHRVETADEVAAIFAARFTLGIPGGVVVANPIPSEAELPASELNTAIEQALAEAEEAGIRGGALTPFVLGRMADATAGRSIGANLALAENNARVATEIARAVAQGR